MGTHAQTRIFEDNECIVCMLRQSDGYPESHGRELFDFLTSKRLINGIANYNSNTEANGIGCLAAQMVVHFKKGIGRIYLQANQGREYEYNYDIYNSDMSEHLSLVVTRQDIVLFEGSLNDFDIWLDNLGKDA